MSVLAIIFVIVAAFFVFKTARRNGHNAVLWTFLTVAVFFGTQFLVGLVLGIILTVGLSAQIFSPSSLNAVSAFFNIVALAAGIGSVVLILNRVNRIKDEETGTVPPPPNFNQSK